MTSFLVNVFLMAIAIVMGLFAKEALIRFKEWRRKRNIDHLAAAVTLSRKKAKYENETCGANWCIPFSEDDWKEMI